jgi:hypothetical protein
VSIDREFAKMIAKGNRPNRNDHPEDQLNHRNGAEHGKRHAPAFCERHADKLAQLIAVYADGAAHDALDMLRDEFWSVDTEEGRGDGG